MSADYQQNLDPSKVVYETYKNEEQIGIMMKMIESELSEPYSIFTYRYFLNGWRELSYLAFYEGEMIGVVIGNLTKHKSQRLRGYVGMIVVKKQFRRLKLGRKLAQMFIDKCKELGADEVCLETECCNIAALKLYQSLGFAKVKKLMNYYLNGNDAYRLKLWFTDKVGREEIEYRQQEELKKLQQQQEKEKENQDEKEQEIIQDKKEQ
ncbi:hypothetical protein ABPG72_014371 [Tetrahymena utriculariae]